MKRPINPHSQSREGSVLVIALVMLSIAGITVGSIMTATTTYSRHARASHFREEAAFLADAGLRAALVKLNASSDGNISFIQSRGYFSATNSFKSVDWGFQTRVASTNGHTLLISVGRYQDVDVDVRAEADLGAGSRSIHALYAHALFAGNSGGDGSYVLRVGGTGSGADFVNGDTYSGNNIELSGDSQLRLPEALSMDFDGDGICDPGTDTWLSAYAPQVFTNPLSLAAFNAYSASMQSHMDNVYNNGHHDEGEAFVDTIGNGVYDVGEPFVDANHNGVRDAGDSFIDRNHNGVYNAGVDTVVDYGNGRYDAGEEWTDDPAHTERQNGTYDPAGGYYDSQGRWKTTYKVGKKKYSCYDWPGEQFEDAGDGNYDPSGETYTDQNGIYDEGEQYLDDRNAVYDYGTQAPGHITGMPSPGPGQRAANGGDAPIDPPDLVHMYYDVNRNSTEPIGALERWGNDVAVTANDFGANGTAITDASVPEHIFVRNPPTSGSVNRGGKTIYGRSYSIVKDNSGARVDDYFLEDPTDPTFNSNPSAYQIAKNDSSRTCTMLINVRPEANVKLYYVDGNVYIHNPQAYSMRFRQPGTVITIVAKGNITISDEFYYNADYPSNLQYANMNSTVVDNPHDALCLIALKNPDCTSDSGNIYIGDQQFGTGGSIHALLYAENDFVDNNINSVDQQFISVFGNMTAGNQVRLNRQVGGGKYRTRLDVTLDARVRNGAIVIPGLPHPVGNQRSIQLDTAWHMVPGTWTSWSMLQ